jgi:Tfp pilus assembly protein PilO
MARVKTENISNNNLMIILLLISLLVVGASALIVKTLFTSIVRDTKVVTAKSAADKQLKDDLDAAPKLVDSYATLGTQATVLADALPNGIDLPSLIVSVENMTADAGLKLKTVAPAQVAVDATGAGAGSTNTDASSAPAPQVYPFSVTFDGTYASLQKFLSDVETSARPMRVTGVQINGSGSALSGEIDMETYYQDKAQLPFSTETIK